jgi:membrane-bound lytic murein transglycosylase D
MGWNLLRREAVAAGALAWLLAALPAAPAAAAPGPLPVEPAARRASAGPAPAAPAAGPRALPAAQGHAAPEVYWIAVPDEDVIDRYAAGLLAGRRDWLQLVLDRSRQYSGFIGEQVRARGLPREIAFLPALESGFQARAMSHKGAAGLWQLMRNTSAPYGLRTDHWLDERRDFWKATEASLSKLADNHRRFGDWDLALAAYNCGAGRLARIVRQNPGLDYWGLRRKGVLPRETAAFVPQFMALARILSHPGRHGLSRGWDPSPRWTRVPVEGSVDLRILARESGVPLDVLAAANPELNFSMTPPKSYGYMLKVPQQHSRAIAETLSTAAVPLLDFDVHVVRTGDTLSGIARSFGVSVAVLQEFNPAVKPLALRVGSRILVPRAGPPASARRMG